MAELTLAVSSQIFLLALLAYAYLRYRARDIRGHGYILVTATFIHYASVLALMVPVLIGEYPIFAADPFDFFALANIIHAVTGAAAMILSTYISARWLLNRFDTRGCRGRNMMRLTILNWVVSLVIGLIMHLTT
ncbi:MAG: hypothetical protein NTV61_04235 [Candidatus Bathyarchaeota archaeon]|nr:hypothetical protein [Candidatus Bathyarchaeota archaeon]